MAKLTTAEFIEAIKELSVLELNELVKACEEEFGVSAAAGVVVAAAGGAGESFCIVNCHLSQHLSVDIHTSQLQAVHELAVGQAVDSCSSVDTGDPQLSELTLSLLTSCIGGGERSHNGLLRNPVLFGSCSSVALCKL